MPILPSSIKAFISNTLGTSVQEVRRISGGSINEAVLLHSDLGPFFLKFNTGSFAAPLLEAEVRGLEHLAKIGQVAVPRIYAQDSVGPHAFLLLEYLPPRREDQAFWETFGRTLAALHRNTAPQFGLDHDNFIGRLPQSNQAADTWEAFYWDQRLWPQIQLALNTGRMTSTDVQQFEAFYPTISDRFPREAPALLHGDLWSGNYLVGKNGQAVFIDPAIGYAHREMDLAMTRLFGGFPPPFYAAYQEAFPLTPGFEERLSWYQLYYLMVHVNLFGGAYAGQVREILQRS